MSELTDQERYEILDEILKSEVPTIIGQYKVLSWNGNGALVNTTAGSIHNSEILKHVSKDMKKAAKKKKEVDLEAGSHDYLGSTD